MPSPPTPLPSSPPSKAIAWVEASTSLSPVTAAPGAIFGHRGAALGLITGWGGTQRLPRLIGKGRALELLVAAEKISAAQALIIGLVGTIATEPVTEAIKQSSQTEHP